MTARDPDSADLLIRGVLIYDGTGARPAIGDVSVTEGRIERLADHIDVPPDEVIDARWLALSLGFIDLHTHDDIAIFSTTTIKPKISQGVTTVVVGNSGISAAPSH